MMAGEHRDAVQSVARPKHGLAWHLVSLLLLGTAVVGMSLYVGVQECGAQEWGIFRLITPPQPTGCSSARPWSY